MGLYPNSVDSGSPAKVYGPLPTHGFTAVALVLHTTETRGMPGFGNGDTAPHYVYNPTSREWTMFAEFEDGYVGTMKGHSNGGHSNCKAFQVEILGYSDGNHSPWVGDFTEENYQDLADFYAWAMDRYGIGDAYTPTPGGGWLYGTSSPHRLTDAAYGELSGLTAHGAVPRNTHWDTGVLDLGLIHDLAMEEHVPGEAPNIDECTDQQRASWQKAYDWDNSLINEHTHPQDVMSKGVYFVFMDRHGIYDTPKDGT